LVPDEAQVVVLGAVAAGFVTVVDCDVAAEQRGSGLDRRGWELGCGAVGRLGSVCRRFRGVGGCFRAGDRVVEVVVNSVGVVDGGCAGIISGDAAHSGGDDGLVGVSSLGAVCMKASAVEAGVV
jgi:hypothetical protein